MAQKVDIHAFRELIEFYAFGREPIEITDGEFVVGVYTPYVHKPTAEDRKAFHEAAERVRAQMEAAGVTEEELVREFEEMRREGRERRRKAS